MKNLYNDPKYSERIVLLKDRLKALQIKYKDNVK